MMLSPLPLPVKEEEMGGAMDTPLVPAASGAWKEGKKADVAVDVVGTGAGGGVGES